MSDASVGPPPLLEVLPLLPPPLLVPPLLPLPLLVLLPLLALPLLPLPPEVLAPLLPPLLSPVPPSPVPPITSSEPPHAGMASVRMTARWKYWIHFASRTGSLSC
jgi:hypothetical protein